MGAGFRGGEGAEGRVPVRAGGWRVTEKGEIAMELGLRTEGFRKGNARNKYSSEREKTKQIGAD